ncbi:hypothetical protein QR680_015807 [Steinernema hermaphroditum]|uniref:7TM GPCR serpentine receptor class x (Srx) domain-containing protein n=1 Tax=Steinernema hermaphroditum TaxID=289476 RepID=A0AA39H9Z6_9BILA|nr:hypothetical protein QR680_015807 [Steinernema hermaphroditum]
MDNSSFVYGSELQGRGYPTVQDIFIGFITFVVSISAVSFGIINLYLIKNMDIFHNAFGWFWASRTLGEVVHNSIHLFYSTTVTLLQPNNIPVPVGIAAYSVGFYFIVESCMMHQCLSFNRFTAVWLPFYCGRIFTKKVCIMAIIFTCVFCFGMAMCYYIFPCNLIGYSPTMYEFVYIKCSPDTPYKISRVGTYVNFYCLVIVCGPAFVLDLFTLSKIVYIKKVLKISNANRNFNRDVRFFAQTFVQNITMVSAAILIVVVNNSHSEETVFIQAFTFNWTIFLHFSNSFGLVVANPEVRILVRTKYTTMKTSVFPRDTTVAPNFTGMRPLPTLT